MYPKVRWGLIGCGDISRKRVAPALRDSPNCELIAVSRAQADLAESFANEFGARRWYSEWQQLLMDYEIDAIYVATPVHLHAEQTIAAAEAGKHVLCEKPMALDVAECDRMISACRSSNVKLGIAYYRHFYPVVRRVKELVDSGELGVPIVAQVNAFEWFDPKPSEARAWLIRKDLAGGGPMFDFGCHRIEVLLDLFGSVSNVKATLATTLFDREVEDVATAVFKFQRGVSGTLTVAHAAQEPQDTFDLFCSEGSIHIPVLNEGTMRVLSCDGTRTEAHPNAKNIHQPLIEDFASAVLEDRAPVVTGEIGREVAMVEEKIYSEAMSGSNATMDEDLLELDREALIAEVQRLRAGIREHRDSTGHELCWHHPKLWALLPEKSDPLPAVPDWPQFLRGCLKYRESLDRQLPNAPRIQQEFDRKR